MYWVSEEALAPLFEVNEALLELMSRVPGGGLQGVDPAVRASIAKCPFLLVDLGFRDARRSGEVVQAHDPFFRRIDAVPLAEMALVAAWSVAREQRDSGACFVLGITVASANRLAAMKQQELKRLADTQWSLIRPRWDRREVWERLAEESGGATTSRFGKVGLRGYQMLFWDLLRAAGF